MAKYLVTWVIDIDDAKSPKEAAKEAFGYMQKEGTSACVFEVKNKKTKKVKTVDLGDHE